MQETHNLHTRVHAQMLTYTCMHTHAPACTHIHLHAHTCTCMHTHAPACTHMHHWAHKAISTYYQRPSATYVSLALTAATRPGLALSQWALDSRGPACLYLLHTSVANQKGLNCRGPPLLCRKGCSAAEGCIGGYAAG